MTYKPVSMVPFTHPWTEKPLGEVACVVVGGTPSTDVPAYWGGDISWMASGDVHQKRITDVEGRVTSLGLRSSNATLVEPPSVAVALAGQGKTRGTAAKVLTRLCTNQSVALITGKPGELHQDYLFHNLGFRYEELRARSSGGGRGGLSKSILENTPIPMPAYEEQAHIGEVLDTLDDAIRGTQDLIDKLTTARRGVLKDFVTKGLRGSAVRAGQGPYRPTAVGQLPIAWGLERVQDTGTVVLGRQRAPKFEKGPHMRPYLRVANVFDGWIDYSDVLWMNFSPAEQVQYQLEHGDILLNEGQSLELVGRSAIYQGDPGCFCFQNTLVRFRSTPGKMLPLFAWMVFKHWLDSGRFMTVAKQTTSVAHLGADRFANMLMPVPPMEEQEAIAAAFFVFDDRLDQEKAHFTKLNALKSGLASDLLTGRARTHPR